LGRHDGILLRRDTTVFVRSRGASVRTSTLIFALSGAACLDALPTRLDVPAPRPTVRSAPQQPTSDLLALIATDRRQFEAAGPGRFTARLGFGLTAELTSQGLRATGREDNVALATVAYGSVEVGGAEPEAGDCAIGEEWAGEAACVRQVELKHGALTEWWVSRGHGLQHGWTLHAPLEDGPVSITVAVSRGEVLDVDVDGAGATVLGSTGALWRYDGLMAWDADGVGLPTRMAHEGTHLTIEVDVVGARWPVTVDPVLSTETKLLASDGAEDDLYGTSVRGAGDINGDGYDDLVVGAPFDDDNEFQSGSVYVYYGSATGIDSTSEDKIIVSDGRSYEYFGHTSGAGDFDGDGYGDLVLGAYGDDEFWLDTGATYIYYGSADGIDITSEQRLLASDRGDSDRFGNAVSGAGDLNGDGYDDLVVGADNDDHAGAYSGSAYVYYGSATGIDSASEVKLTASDAESRDAFGVSVSGAGDVNGDGYDDLIIGADGDEVGKEPYAGSAYMYPGSVFGIDAASVQKISASDASEGAYFGVSVSAAGDLDGDGYADLVLGAFGDGTVADYGGSAYVYYGSAAGIDIGSEHKLTAWDLAAHDWFGFSVSGAGDLDGDGYDDVIVGASQDDDDGSNSGSAYVYYGSAAGIDSAWAHKFTASSGGSSDIFAWSVSGAGDVDADGYGDLVVGAPRDDDRGLESGSAYVFRGGCRDFDGDTFWCDVDCDDRDPTTYPGAAAADSPTACMTDADGDGYGDISPAVGVTAGADCDDGDPSVSPAAVTEGVGDEVDQDCDGTERCYVDADDDGFVDGSTTVASADADCADAGEGSATEPSGDCDDTDALIHPAATEVVGDEVDQDCDGAETCYADADDDGYIDGSTTVASADADCGDRGEGVATDTLGECDDTDATVHPGVIEVEGDGVDQDCDGADAPAVGDEPGDEPEGDQPGGEGKGGCGGCASITGPWLTPPPRASSEGATSSAIAADRALLPLSALPAGSAPPPTASVEPPLPLVGAGPSSAAAWLLLGLLGARRRRRSTGCERRVL
jgi:hypothetical protein